MVAGLVDSFRRVGNAAAVADVERVAVLLGRVRPFALEPVPVRGEGVARIRRRLTTLPAADQRAVLLAACWTTIDPERISQLLRVGWVCCVANRPGKPAAVAVRELLAGIPKPDAWRVVNSPSARVAAGEYALRLVLIALAGGNHLDAVGCLIDSARRLNPRPESWGARHAAARIGLLIDAACLDHPSACRVVTDRTIGPLLV